MSNQLNTISNNDNHKNHKVPLMFCCQCYIEQNTSIKESKLDKIKYLLKTTKEFNEYNILVDIQRILDFD